MEISLLNPGRVLFSRYEDGAVRRVEVLTDGVYQVEGLGQFRTNKGLLAALTGHPTGRHWSLERYFRLGVSGHHGKSGGRGKPKRPKTVVHQTEYNVFDILSGWGATPEKKLGIDLAKRGHEVRKLLFAGFGRQMYLSGYDPEDVLQEVYKGILVRNEGTCPWDGSVSSFGHYVHLVITCILSNYRRKQNRIRAVEQVGLPSYSNEPDVQMTDVASNTTIPAAPTSAAEAQEFVETMDDFADYLYDIDSPDTRLAAQLLPLLAAGRPRETLAKQLGTSNAAVTRSLALLRRMAPAWKTSRQAG